MSAFGPIRPQTFGSVALAAVLVALYLLYGPAVATTGAVGNAAVSIATAGLMLACSYALGRVVLLRMAPAILGEVAGWAFALALGIGLLGLLLSAFSAVNINSDWAKGLILALGLAAHFVRPPAGPVFAIPAAHAVPAWAIALLAVLLVPAAILALAPPTDTDEIYQHLALARRIAEDGGLRGGFDSPEGSRPQWVQVSFAAAYSVGGAAAARFWHLGIVAALLFAAAELGSARFGPGRSVAPVLVAATSYTFLHEAGMAYNDLPAAFFLLLAAELPLREGGLTGADSGNAAALRADPRVCTANSGGPGSARLPVATLIFGNFFGPRRGAEKAAIEQVSGSQKTATAIIFGLFLGFAVTAKFTAGPAAAALGLGFLATNLKRGGIHSIRGPLIAGVVAFAVLAPWLLRNAASGLHPLFPYVGWPAVDGFRFLYAEKYGVGHTWGDALRLPLDMLLTARIDSFVFLGQLSYGWAALALGAALACVRRQDARMLALPLVVGFVVWANTGQLLRYLLPLVGIAMLLGAAGRWHKVAILLAVVSLPANVFPVLADAARATPVAAGKETETDYLSRELPAWPALAYLRQHVPPDERVALLYAWQDYWIIQPAVLGSVEDHTPTRHWLVSHGDSSLTDLYEQGVRWLFVGGSGFLRKTYVFLDEPAYQQQFVEPRERLERLLLRDATREFAHGHWAVWRLDAPQGGD